MVGSVCSPDLRLTYGFQTNPLPLRKSLHSGPHYTALTVCPERVINNDPHVQDCIVFGYGRFQIGVLVQPTPELAIDPADEAALVKFRNTIW